MKKMCTRAARPVRRNLTIADMRAAKGKRKLVEVTANRAGEAAAPVAGMDRTIGNAVSVEAVEAGSPY